MKKKVISALLCATMVSSMLFGCGSKEAEAPAAEAETQTETETETETATEETADTTEASAEGGSVYYLNFKPEVDAQWQEIAAAFD